MSKNRLQNVYHWIVVIAFFSLLAGFAVAEICVPDKEISQSERRYYEQMPELSLASVMDGSYMQKLEKYLLDQFVGRDAFRIAKSIIQDAFCVRHFSTIPITIVRYLIP